MGKSLITVESMQALHFIVSPGLVIVVHFMQQVERERDGEKNKRYSNRNECLRSSPPLCSTLAGLEASDYKPSTAQCYTLLLHNLDSFPKRT